MDLKTRILFAALVLAFGCFSCNPDERATGAKKPGSALQRPSTSGTSTPAEMDELVRKLKQQEQALAAEERRLQQFQSDLNQEQLRLANLKAELHDKEIELLERDNELQAREERLAQGLESLSWQRSLAFGIFGLGIVLVVFSVIQFRKARQTYEEARENRPSQTKSKEKEAATKKPGTTKGSTKSGKRAKSSSTQKPDAEAQSPSEKPKDS